MLGQTRDVQPNPTLWRIYQPMIWFCAITSAIAWPGIDAAVDWPMVLMLVIAANAADLFAVRVRAGMRVSTNHLAVPAALVVAGPTAALIVAATCNLGRLAVNRSDWNTFDIAVNVSSASVASVVFGGLQLAVDGSFAGHAAVAMVTLVTYALFRQLVNYGWTLDVRSRGIALPRLSLQIGRLMLAAAVLLSPGVSLLAVTYADRGFSIDGLLALLLPFAATQFMVRAFGRERDLNEELEDANVSLTESLVNALDARDRYSAGHSVAVAVYARDIAIEIGLEPHRVQRVYLAGLLHDIGKIAVPDAILKKPGALTDEEFAEIRKHPVVGEEILRPSKHLADILPAVRNHHERIDGKGYPDRLADADIPLDARIIAVADAYNAMTSDRPYRDAMEPELAVRILVQNQGMQHDPFLVAAFQRVLASRHHDYAIAIGDDFATSHALHDLVHGTDGSQAMKLNGRPRPLRIADMDDHSDFDDSAKAA